MTLPDPAALAAALQRVQEWHAAVKLSREFGAFPAPMIKLRDVSRAETLLADAYLALAAALPALLQAGCELDACVNVALDGDRLTPELRAVCLSDLRAWDAARLVVEGLLPDLAAGKGGEGK